MNVVDWEPVVAKFVSTYGKNMPKDKRDDLHQEIYVALLEDVLRTDASPRTEARILEIASNVADRLHAHRVFEEKFCEIPGPLRTSSLETNVAVQQAIASLPLADQQIAEELFFLGLSQEEIATRHRRTQPWVAKYKRQILTKLKTILKS
jgi:DNA-directed RNA polymerase specialized sigma subunit